METYEILDLVTMQKKIADQKGVPDRYLEFFIGDNLSMGLYVLPKGDIDPQVPHTEDEIYYVVSGRAILNVEGEERPVKPGTVIFVETGADHKFHSITENLMLLVVFAPPRGSQAPVPDESEGEE